MDTSTRKAAITDAQIRAIIDDTERQALGGAGRAVARAGLGTLAIVLAVLASTNTQTVGLVLLSGAFILGLAAYIHSVARSISTKPRISAPPARPEAARPTASPATTPATAASSETVPATPAIPTAALGGIAGGGWSRLSQKQEA